MRLVFFVRTALIAFAFIVEELRDGKVNERLRPVGSHGMSVRCKGRHRILRGLTTVQGAGGAGRQVSTVGSVGDAKPGEANELSPDRLESGEMTGTRFAASVRSARSVSWRWAEARTA